MREVETSLSAGEASGGLVVIPDAFTVAHRAEIIALADRTAFLPFPGLARSPNWAA